MQAEFKFRKVHPFIKKGNIVYMEIGGYIQSTAFADEKYCDRPARYASDDSGMSGYGGMEHTHSGELDAMWLTTRNPGEHNVITFDLNAVLQIGLMAVWNFNQAGFTGAGLRDVRIYHSCDNLTWIELKGAGYPYRFACADGTTKQKATNLDDGANTPIDFDGTSARYIKIVPDVEQFVGNWGNYVECQHRFGLSQARFFKYSPRVQSGGYIPSTAISAEGALENNLTNGYGMSDADSACAVMSSNPDAMWLSELQACNRSIIFDLDGTYPLSEMHIWNYNEPNNVNAGLKNVRIYHSINRAEWTELDSGDGTPFLLAMAQGCDGQPATNLNDGKNSPIRFGGVRARFVKLELAGGMGNGTWGAYNLYEDRFGLSKVRFYAAEGYCTEPCRSLSAQFSNYDGWGGADGIFMAPLNGVERRPNAGQPITDTIAIFSDSLIGSADPVTHRRKKYMVVNNTAAYVSDGADGQMKFDFIYNTDENGVPIGMIADDKLTSNDLEFYKGNFYWLQDCFIHNKKLYSFTDNMTENMEGAEGFQFKMLGVDRVSFNIKDGKVDFANPAIVRTPLFRDEGLYFGCSILPNTYEAGLPGADGYIYVYGLLSSWPYKQMVVARVKSENFEDFDWFEYYDGSQFQPDINLSAPICDEASSEMSVMPIDSGIHAGKYLFVYSVSSISDTIACRIGDTPYGPFGESIPLYFVDEPRRLAEFGGKKFYAYNAKAHYHVSPPGEMLISYNMNTTDFESHIINADIYRPRFIRIREL